MRLAITGGRGLLGRAVTEQAVARGDTVVSIDRVQVVGAVGAVGAVEEREAVTHVQGDTADYDLLAASFAGCDAVLHLAAIPVPFGEPDHVVHNNNVVASYNALRAAVESGITRICQASSVNAIGLSFSRAGRFDYFPLDEEHPTYAEDAYGLSKWICEAQADALARRYEGLSIASMRLHWVVPHRDRALQAYGNTDPETVKQLWAYTAQDAAVRACLLGLDGRFEGHEAFFVTAPDSVGPRPSRELAARFYPQAQIRGDFAGNAGFFSCAKAERVLGWRHDDPA